LETVGVEFEGISLFFVSLLSVLIFTAEFVEFAMVFDGVGEFLCALFLGVGDGGRIVALGGLIGLGEFERVLGLSLRMGAGEGGEGEGGGRGGAGVELEAGGVGRVLLGPVRIGLLGRVFVVDVLFGVLGLVCLKSLRLVFVEDVVFVEVAGVVFMAVVAFLTLGSFVRLVCLLAFVTLV